MKRVLLSICLGAGLLGCTSEIILDGGIEPPPGPARALTVESEPTLTLAFGEAAPIEARLTELDAPVTDGTVRFGFAGTAQDSTLADLERATGPDGRVATMLTAGSVAAVFRVRASSERADPAFVDVAVGNDGFGAIEVTAPYDGTRSDYTRRVVNIYADVPCDSESFPRSAARTQVLDDPTEDTVLFRTLSAGLAYTVVGRVEGPTGASLATACLDMREVTRDEVTVVQLDFEDARLIPDGQYEAELTVETMFFEPAMQLGLMANAPLNTTEAAALYLDALEAELGARGETTALAVLTADRMAGTADASLAMRLAASSEGPSLALTTFFDDLTERLEGVRVSGPLTLTLEGPAIEATWEARDLVVGPMPAPDAPDPLFLDPSALRLTPALELRWDGSDTLSIDSLSFGLPIAELVTAAMGAAAIEAGSAGAALSPMSGCGAFAMWVAESPQLSMACDATCSETACFAALGGLFDNARGAIATASLERDRMSVSGDVTLYDDNADLMVDRIDGTVDGAWSGPAPLPADAVSGTLRGARTVITE